MKVLHNTHVNITNEHMGLSPFYSRVRINMAHSKPMRMGKMNQRVLWGHPLISP